MNYMNGNKISLGDIVTWKSNSIDRGIVVCIINENTFIDGYDFSYLKDNGGGIMILFEIMGLIQIMEDDKNISIHFDSRLNTMDTLNFIRKIESQFNNTIIE